MTPSPNSRLTAPGLLTAIAVLIAGVLFVRLGGTGRTSLPGGGTLLLLLLLTLGMRGALRANRASPGRLRDHLAALLKRHAFALVLLAITASSLFIRLPSIASDLGHQPMDIDEARLASNIRHFFVYGEVVHTTVEHYPGLVFWLLSGAALVGYMMAVLHGTIQGIGDMPLELFVESGRVANALIGAGTVAVTGLLGRRFAGRATGLLGALLVAVAPLAVQTTTSLRNDPGQVLALVAAVYAALRASQTDRHGWPAAAGAFAGLATAIKYTSLFALAPALLGVALAGPLPRRAARALVALSAFVLAVATTNHFIWADFPNFIKQLSDQVAITGATHWAASDNPSAFHVAILDRFGPGWPLLVLAAAGGAWTLGHGRAAAWIFWSFPLLYSWFATQRPAQFPRWVYPLLPFVVLGAAQALTASLRGAQRWTGWQRLPSGQWLRRAAIGIAVIALLWLPLHSGAVNAGRRMTAPTQTVVERWLIDHAAGQSVLLEDHWLDLTGSGVRAVRVPDLPAALAAGLYSLAATDLVVVPEIHFGLPALRRLQFVHRVAADQRSIAGNLGYDFEIYATPPVPAVAGGDERLGTPEAAPFFGPGWGPGRDPLAGVDLPSAGASLFLPPLTHATVRLALAVRAPIGTALPISLTIDGQPVALTPEATSTLERRLTATVTLPRPQRSTELRLAPAPGAGAVQAVGLAFE